MIVDTSAIVAIVMQEPEYAVLNRKPSRATALGIGAPTLAECDIVLSARLGRDTRGLLSRFWIANQVTVIPFTDVHYRIAVSAWLQYGKGRHPARLNFGDCLTYAVAKMADQPLLCIGDDFRQTDIAVA